MTYVSPAYDKTAFNCPYCRAFAHQSWFGMGGYPVHDGRNIYEEFTGQVSGEPRVSKDDQGGSFDRDFDGVRASNCNHCNQIAFWAGDRLI